MALALFQSLGLLINQKKSALSPVQRIDLSRAALGMLSPEREILHSVLSNLGDTTQPAKNCKKPSTILGPHVGLHLWTSDSFR